MEGQAASPDGLRRTSQDCGESDSSEVSPESYMLAPSWDGELTYCLGPVVLSALALEDARAAIDGIELIFTPEGVQSFNAVAVACFDDGPTCPSGRLALVLGGRVLTAPSINAPEFERDAVVVSGGFNNAEVERIAESIRSSILPESGDFALDFRPLIFEVLTKEVE